MPEVATIGLVIPTAWEAKDIFKQFSFRPADHKLYGATIGHRTVLATISGVGGAAASRAATELVKAGAKELISVGFCGALVPELHVGDLVTDRIVSVDRPVRTPEERRVLTQHANAVAVDMETRAVVEAGTRLGVPIRVIRAVSDEWSDDLRPLFGANGSFSPLGIALRLLNPFVWPLARKLHRQSHTARQTLVKALRDHCAK